MARSRRAYSVKDLNHIQHALTYLVQARRRLRQAGAVRAASYVQRALKSAQGAYEHARLRQYQGPLSERQTTPT